MDVTVSMDSILNFINSMSLSANNKEWLGRHLIEEAKAESCANDANNSAMKGKFEEYPLPQRLRRLQGCIKISQEDIDKDERLAYILNK